MSEKKITKKIKSGKEVAETLKKAKIKKANPHSKLSSFTKNIWEDFDKVDLHKNIIPREVWENLLPEQAYFLPFLLRCNTLTATCRESKIPHSTFSVWYSEPGFRDAVNRIKKLKYRITMFRVLEHSETALDVLFAKMHSTDEKISLQAANIVLEKAEKMLEFEEIELKLSNITEQLASRKFTDLPAPSPIFLGK